MSEKGPRICILSARFWPYYPRYGTAHPFTLAQSLVDTGFRVVVVTSFPRDIDGKMLPEYRFKLMTRENLGDIEIIRVSVLPLDRIGLIQKLAFNITFMVTSLFAYSKVGDFDLLFGIDPDAPFLLFPSYIYSRLKKVKYLLLVTDLWPDVVFDYNLVSSKLLKRIISKWSTLSYDLSDKILTITNDLKKSMLRYVEDPDDIAVVELAVDLSVFQPQGLSEQELVLMDLPSKQDKFVVLYSGSMSIMYDFDVMIEAASILRDYKDILFVIRGQGEQSQHIIDEVAARGLENVMVRGVVPNIEDVVKYVNYADVCVIPLARASSEDITHPSKLFEFWSCGKPVIVASRGELTKLVKKSGAGIAVEVDSPQQLVDSILQLNNNRDTGSKMGETGRRYVDSRFSTHIMEKNMRDLVESML